MITARPGANSTSIPILTEVLELPAQLTTPVPAVPQELVPQHLAPAPVEPPLPEPLVMRTRGQADFSARLVDAAGLSDHVVPEPQVGGAVAPVLDAAMAAEAAAPVAETATPSTAAPTAATASTAAIMAQSAVTPLRAVPASPPQPTAAPEPSLDLDALADRLRAEVLADLQARIEPALRARMVQRLEPVLRTALADITDALQDEISGLVDEAVQKALIRHVTSLD
jgi:hypothetical protein